MAYSEPGEVKKYNNGQSKLNASKAVNDARVAVQAVYDDVTVAAHNPLKDGAVEAQKVSDDVKISVHKVISDAKIASHEDGSSLKK